MLSVESLSCDYAMQPSTLPGRAPFSLSCHDPETSTFFIWKWLR